MLLYLFAACMRDTLVSVLGVLRDVAELDVLAAGRLLHRIDASCIECGLRTVVRTLQELTAHERISES